uniref:Uncharacterized protein n=1 Tax=Setaria viridis TaxID=4556 RepID=A0A4U6TD71_SETVI|nr:hypothetical protein SEVIR_8G083500v2 [Setaria viridis]
MSKYWRPTRASAVSRRSWATWLLGFVGSSLPLEKIERTGPRLLPFPSQSSLRPALPAAFLRADARALGSRALLLSSPPPSGHDSDRPQRRWRHGGTSGAVRQSGDRLQSRPPKPVSSVPMDIPALSLHTTQGHDAMFVMDMILRLQQRTMYLPMVHLIIHVILT